MDCGQKYSFPPIEDGHLEILILGSLPGDESIRRGQYYAHPRNRFWPLMAKLLGKSLPDDYAERTEMLLSAHIGLWDVAHSAIRAGSADIQISDEVPNDIRSLIERNPRLHTIVFNGRKAEAMFGKHFPQKTDVRCLLMPSTSPANAQKNLDLLMQDWSRILSL
ncbi:DNA-deoxyinosine glycosylase [Porphyromonas gulae]|uniref:DNA-deoxyinosine glycosylase n=1 Tax=Porphyromonas gulae TaxID=111105 RepID=UPI0026F03D6C|nr:DNA-deoxyinosine glycosylase [Porphyromonas gulae]